MGYYANRKLMEIINEVASKIKNKKSSDDHNKKKEKEQKAPENR